MLFMLSGLYVWSGPSSPPYQQLVPVRQGQLLAGQELVVTLLATPAFYPLRYEETDSWVGRNIYLYVSKLSSGSLVFWSFV